MALFRAILSRIHPSGGPAGKFGGPAEEFSGPAEEFGGSKIVMGTVPNEFYELSENRPL